MYPENLLTQIYGTRTDQCIPRSDKWKGANMGKNSKMTYHEQTDMENTLKLREVLKSLPAFANDFSAPSAPPHPQAPELNTPMI